jgi:hypothetical protein
VVLPPSTADCLNEISYDELDTSDRKMVANNFVAWLKDGYSNHSFLVRTDFCSVQDLGWMYHLSRGSNEKRECYTQQMFLLLLSDIRKARTMVEFLATHMVRYQIVVFLPLSVCWWATDKKICNKQMKRLMLPKCTVQVTKTKGFTNKTVKQLKDTIDVDTMKLKTNGFVLKANIGCGAATVWRITFCGNKEWQSCSIAGNLKDWPEPGKYESEHWLPNAPNEEQRTFATTKGFCKAWWMRVLSVCKVQNHQVCCLVQVIWYFGLIASRM